jgi:hypothetical protein
MAAAAMTPRWSETALSPASFPGVSFSIDALPLIRFFLGSEGHSTTGSGRPRICADDTDFSFPDGEHVDTGLVLMG